MDGGTAQARLKNLIERYRMADEESGAKKQDTPVSEIPTDKDQSIFFTLQEYLGALPEITHHPLRWLFSFVKPREESGLTIYKDVHIRDIIRDVQYLRGEDVATHTMGDFVWVTTKSTFDMEPRICVPTSPEFKNILGHPKINKYGFAFECAWQDGSTQKDKALVRNGEVFSVGDTFTIRQEFKVAYVRRGDRKEYPVFGIDGFPCNMRHI